MFTAIVIGLVVVAILNFGALKNIFFAARSQIGRAGSAILGADPLSNHRQLIKDKAKDVGKAKRGLSEVEAERLRLNKLIEQNDIDIEKLTSRIKLALANDKVKDAQDFALKLDSKKQEKQKNLAALEDNVKELESFAGKIEKAESNLEQSKERAVQMSNELLIAENRVALQSLSASFDADATDSLKQSEEAVQKRINSLQGQVNISERFEDKTDEIYEKLEKEERAKQLLKEFSNEK